MSDMVVDSSVVAKWILPEADSTQAQRLITEVASTGERLIVLDLVFPEVANAIWKRHRQRLITLDEARGFLSALALTPLRVEPAARLLGSALEIAVKYDHAVYDALFVALAQDLHLKGITADEPLFNVVRADIPQIVLLRATAARVLLILARDTGEDGMNPLRHAFGEPHLASTTHCSADQSSSAGTRRTLSSPCSRSSRSICAIRRA